MKCKLFLKNAGVQAVVEHKKSTEKIFCLSENCMG